MAPILPSMRTLTPNQTTPFNAKMNTKMDNILDSHFFHLLQPTSKSRYSGYTNIKAPDNSSLHRFIDTPTRRKVDSIAWLGWQKRRLCPSRVRLLRAETRGGGKKARLSNCLSLDYLALTALMFNWGDSYDAKVSCPSPTTAISSELSVNHESW